jgi:malonyl CoA-acyl carrier protein transacylase
MSAEINYKNKYMELRSKYLNDVDVAFRLGFEQGGMQAQQDQMAQEQQQAQEMQQAAAQGAAQPGGAPGEGQPGQPEQSQETGSEHPEGSELDQHIAKLESMIAKPDGASPQELGKSIEDLKKLTKSWKEQSDLRKSQNAIKGIVKALHKPAFKMSKQASINLNDTAKQAVTMQHKIVSDVMAKMEAEEKRATNSVETILAGLPKA